MLLGSSLHIEHMSEVTPLEPDLYRDVQDLTLAELSVMAARGMAEGLGLEARLPLRWTRERIRYEDPAGAPYTPPLPELHHRNETLVGPGDPWLVLVAGSAAGEFSYAGRLGLSIPLGRSEPNPFDQGRLGISHQHIQYGSGTWDPIVGAAARRRFGGTGVELFAQARLGFFENDHGFRPGHRGQAALYVGHGFAGTWRGTAGLEVMHEEPERWNGRLEAEGNLGRTDLVAAAGIGRRFEGIGRLDLFARVPVANQSTGSQVDPATALLISWSP